MADSVLFVIIDPKREQQPALMRAADIVQQMGGHIHVFCCDYQEDLSAFASRSDAKRQTLDHARQKTTELIAPLQQQGLSIEVEVAWNRYWYQAAIHACARASADLLLKSSYADHGRQHFLSKNSAHYLLRRSSCPVLLATAPKPQALKTALAAVAIEEGDHQHDTLNNRIVAQGKRICRATGATLHLVAAIKNKADISGLLHLLADDNEVAATDQALIEQRFGVETDCIHVASGPAHKVILDTARRLNPELVIIGTLGREGIAGALVGNTAEKVLHQLDRDILVIN